MKTKAKPNYSNEYKKAVIATLKANPMTLKEAVEYFGVAQKTLEEWISAERDRQRYEACRMTTPPRPDKVFRGRTSETVKVIVAGWNLA